MSATAKKTVSAKKTAVKKGVGVKKPAGVKKGGAAGAKVQGGGSQGEERRHQENRR